MNIYPDEEGAGETQLWEGFTGVPKFTDIETYGVSNPRGRTLEDEEEQITEEDQLNDQYSDGISNEDAGYGEDSQETSDYGEDLYGEDGSYLGDSGEDSSYDETSEEQDTGGSRNTRDTDGTQDDGSEEDSDTQ